MIFYLVDRAELLTNKSTKFTMYDGWGLRAFRRPWHTGHAMSLCEDFVLSICLIRFCRGQSNVGGLGKEATLISCLRYLLRVFIHII